MASPKTMLDLPANVLAAILACLAKQPASDTPRPKELVVVDFASLRLSCKSLRDAVNGNLHSLAIPAAKLPTHKLRSGQAAYFHVFPAVRELALHAAGQRHVQFEHLAELMLQLQTLTVGGDRELMPVVSLTALVGLRTLTMLNLEECSVNINTLSSLPQLTQLILFERAVSGAYCSLQHVRHLDLRGSLEDMEQLRTLVGLTHLEVDGNDISYLTRLVALEHLDFTPCSQADPMFLGLVSLSDLTRLTYLEILCSGCHLVDASALAALPQLQRLVLDVPASSLPLSALLQLVHVELREVYDADLQALARLSQLTHLVSDRWVVTNFQAMSSLHQLRVLKLRDDVWGERVVDGDSVRLAHLSVLTALQELNLDTFCNVVDMSYLSALHRLRCLELVDCNWVKDISFIYVLASVDQAALAWCWHG